MTLHKVPTFVRRWEKSSLGLGHSDNLLIRPERQRLSYLNRSRDFLPTPPPAHCHKNNKWLLTPIAKLLVSPVIGLDTSATTETQWSNKPSIQVSGRNFCSSVQASEHATRSIRNQCSKMGSGPNWSLLKARGKGFNQRSQLAVQPHGQKNKKTRVLISTKATCSTRDMWAIVQTFATRWSTEHNGGCHIGFRPPEEQKKWS